MNPLHKKILFAAIGVVVLAGIVVGVLLWSTSPRRAMADFLEAVEAKNEEQAMAMVSADIKKTTREEIQWFVEDWVSGETIETEVTTDESWRTRDKMVKNEAGEMVQQVNKKGVVKKEIKPTPNYWAHNHQAFVTVTFDDYEDPVIIKMRRKTENGWSIFAQVFRGWEVTAVKYQPLDEEDFEDLLESGDEFEEFDDETADDETEGITAEEEEADDDSAAGIVEEGSGEEDPDASSERLQEGSDAEDPNTVDEEETEE